MLTELHIRSFALIDDLRLEVGDFSLTGELVPPTPEP